MDKARTNHISMGKSINSLGLILDIIGVVILFKFGLPSEVSKEGEQLIAADKPKESQLNKYRKYEFWSRFGLALLIVGFLCQLVSNYID